MMAISLDDFSGQLIVSTLLGADEVATLRTTAAPEDAEQFARWLVRQRKLTAYQAQQLYAGKGKALVLGNYAILDKLGQGGMGMVLKAEHRRMKRVVALKVLSPAVTKTPDLLKRFQREVQAAARLTHPNIVQAFDADEVRGTHFLVMEYVAGSDLSSIIKKKGVMSLDLALNCLLQSARGLEFAHQRGVIHRDIKPANLLLNEEGQVKILDMGLARLTGEGDDGHDLTSTGAVMGTVDYMAPEQAEDTRTAAAPADIYSLGCTLFYLLIGRSIYDGDNLMKRLLAHRNQPIPSLTALRGEIPPEVDALFAKMVAKEPDDRFASMTDVITAIEHFQTPDKSLSPPSFSIAPSEDSRFGEFLERLPTQVKPSSAATSPHPLQTVAMPVEAVTMVTAHPASPTQELRKSPVTELFRTRSRNRLLMGLGGLSFLLLCGVIFITITGQDGKPARIDVSDDSRIEITRASAIPAPAIPASAVPEPPSSAMQPATAQPPPKAPVPAVIEADEDNQPVLPLFALPFDGVANFVSIPSLTLGDSGELTYEARLTLAPIQKGSPVQLLYMPCADVGEETSDLRVQIVYAREGDATEMRAIDFGRRIGSNFFHRRFPLAAMPDEPIHLAAVLQDGDYRLYLNGEPQTGTSREVVMRSQRPLPGETELMGLTSFSNFLQGAVTEVRVSRNARYSEAFQPPELLTADAQSLACYRFGDVAGGHLPDRTGNGHTATLEGFRNLSLIEEYRRNFDIAKFVIHRQGAVRLMGNRADDFTRLQELPREPFQVSVISFDQKSAVTDADLANFQGLTTLNQLRLNSPAISDQGLEQVRNLPNLSYVDLFRSACSPEGFSRLAQDTPTLTTLVISADAQVVNLAERLRPNKRLSLLTPFRISTRERFLEMATLSELRELRLGYVADYVPDEAAVAEFYRLAPYCRITDKDGNILGDDPHRALFRRLHAAGWNWMYGTTPQLDFSQPLPNRLPFISTIVPPKGRPLTAEEVRDVCAAAYNAYKFDGVDCQLADDVAVLITDLRRLEIVDLSRTQITDATVSTFGPLAVLTDLILDDTAVTGSSFAELRGLHNLTKLSLVRSQLAPQNLQPLANLPRLSNLNLQSTRLDDAAVPQLVALKSLARLNITDTQISELGLEQIKTALPNCEVLWTPPLPRPDIDMLLDDTDPATLGWAGWPRDAPAPAIAPFDSDRAVQHQEAWARYLHVPVTYRNAAGMELRLIPPGEYLAGVGPKDFDPQDWPVNHPMIMLQPETIEAPRHRVIISQPFYLGVHEVTQDQFQRVMQFNPSAFRADGGRMEVAGVPDTGTMPAESMSWMEAVEFTRLLAKLDEFQLTKLPQQRAYRLPTEAEWEFSCRAGTTTRYWMGDEAEATINGCWSVLIGENRPQPVGQLAPNPFGLYDTLGNVWEFTSDYHSREYHQQAVTYDPRSPYGELIAVRGGGFRDAQLRTVTTRRFGRPRDYRSENLGFRVALSVNAVRQRLQLPPIQPHPKVADPDRAAAMWVLKQGGFVEIDIYDYRLQGSQSWRVTRLEELPAVPFQLRLVNMREKQSDGDSDLHRFARLPHLYHLEIARIPAISDAGLESLLGLPSLGALWLDGTAVTVEGLSKLKQLPGLYRLAVFAEQSLTDGGQALSELPRLNFLTLVRAQRPEQLLQAVKNPNLRLLSVISYRGDPPDEALLKKLAEANPRCRFQFNYAVQEPRPEPAAIQRLLDAGWKIEVHRDGRSFWAQQPEDIVADGGLHGIQRLMIPPGTTPTDEQWLDASMLPDLINLDAIGANITDEMVKNLLHFTNLRQVHLAGTQITDAGASRLASLTTLEDLNLRHTAITNACLPQIASLPNLKRLQLSRTQVDGNGLQFLGSAGGLQHLFLQGLSVTGTDLEPLSQLRKLSWVFLNETPITPEAASWLRRSFHYVNDIKCTPVLGLIPDENTPKRDRWVAEWLIGERRPIAVRKLNEDSLHTIGDWQPFPAETFRLTKAQLSLFSSPLSPQDLTVLHDLPELETLGLDERLFNLKPYLDELGNLPSLGILSVPTAKFTDDELLQSLARYPAVFAIRADDQHLVQNREAVLAAFPRLTRWSIGPFSGRSHLSVNQVLDFAGQPQIRHLRLNSADQLDAWGPDVLQQLHARNPLCRVSTDGWPQAFGTDPRSVIIPEMQTLGWQFAVETPPPDRQARIMPRFEQGTVPLEWLQPSQISIPAQIVVTAEQLRKATVCYDSVLRIQAAGTRLDDAAAAGFIQFVALRTLDLSQTAVGDDGLKPLKLMPSLRDVHLSDTRVTAAGLQYLAKLPVLQQLDLAGSQVDDTLADVLASTKSLRSLDLRRTAVTAESVQKLKAALPDCEIRHGD